jgi:hypothetical protein
MQIAIYKNGQIIAILQIAIYKTDKLLQQSEIGRF